MCIDTSNILWAILYCMCEKEDEWNSIHLFVFTPFNFQLTECERKQGRGDMGGTGLKKAV